MVALPKCTSTAPSKFSSPRPAVFALVIGNAAVGVLATIMAIADRGDVVRVPDRSDIWSPFSDELVTPEVGVTSTAASLEAGTSEAF